MSIRVWGVFKLINESISENELDKYSFQIVNIATDNLIGIKLSVNVSNDFYRRCVQTNRYLPFELIDNPRTNVAEVLFLGQGISLQVGDKILNTSESLDSRMQRVQNFLERVFSLNITESIIFHIDGGFGEEYTHNIKAGGFKTQITELFLHELDNGTPSVKLVISK